MRMVALAVALVVSVVALVIRMVALAAASVVQDSGSDHSSNRGLFPVGEEFFLFEQQYKCPHQSAAA
ncbi:hypothetical protein D3C85_1908120 [compost metagenome]